MAASAASFASDDVCEDDSLFGSIHLGASYNELFTPTTTAAAGATSTKLLDSLSSISFDASYASVFGEHGNSIKSPVSSRRNSLTSNSKNLCLSRWESLGDGSSTRLGLLLGEEPPVLQRAVSGETNITASSIMAVQMPLRQPSSHSSTRRPVPRPQRRVSLSGGEQQQQQQQQQQYHQQQNQPHRLLGNLPPRPAMTKFKEDISRRRLLTRAASEKSGLGLGAASNHTFAAYSLLGGGQLSSSSSSKHSTSAGSLSQRTSSTTTPPSSLNHPSLAPASSHTFASSFANGTSNHTGILSTWDSLDEKSFEEDDDDSTIASFSSSASVLTLARKLNKKQQQQQQQRQPTQC
jgi:hypothetical protein